MGKSRRYNEYTITSQKITGTAYSVNGPKLAEKALHSNSTEQEDIESGKTFIKSNVWSFSFHQFHIITTDDINLFGSARREF